MKVGTYRRVSTDIQREEGVSLHTQNERLNNFAASQGWTIVEDYSDEGFSAKDMNRPQLQRLIQDIEAKKIDILLVYRLDRLVRSVSDLHQLLKIMDQHDVKFKSCTEVFDTTNATGRLFITIIATLAQWERETIAERVYDNMLERSEMGLRNGAPAPYGYEYNEQKELIQVPEEAKWVKFMFTKYVSTGSQNIAKALNKRGVRTKKGELWSDFSVRYVLRNPIYSGYVRWNRRSFSKKKYTGKDVIREFKQNNFVPVITKEEWDDCQKLMQQRSTMAFRSDNYYPFSGIACCAQCGQKLTGAYKKRKSGGVYRYYKCAGRFRLGICDAPIIGEEAIEVAFLECLRMADFYINYESQNKIDRVELERDLTRLNGRLERTKELYIEGDITREEYNKRMQELQLMEQSIESTLNSAQEEVSREELAQFAEVLKTEWNDLSYETKKTAVASIFKSLTVELIKEPKTGRYPEAGIVKITGYEFS